MATGRFVIVGASLAGASAAAALRDGGFEGALTLIGEEARLPYSRPALSKGYLRGQERFDDQLVNPADYYDKHRITLRLDARATRVDPARREGQLGGDETGPYDRLLVTTGGAKPPPPPPPPGPPPPLPRPPAGERGPARPRAPAP